MITDKINDILEGFGVYITNFILEGSSHTFIFLINYKGKNAIMKIYLDNIFASSNYIMETISYNNIECSLAPKMLYNLILKDNNYTYFIIITEYINDNLINKFNTKVIPEKYYNKLLIKIYKLHSCNIVHRDIKPGNILVDDIDECKFIDFGISFHFDKTPIKYILNVSMANMYQSPDIVLRSFFQDHFIYTKESLIEVWKKSDLFSFLCLFIYSSRDNDSPSEIFELKGQIPIYCLSMKHILKDYIKLGSKVAFIEIEDIYYTELKKCLNYHVNPPNTMSEFGNYIENKLRLFISNIDDKYDSLVKDLSYCAYI